MRDEPLQQVEKLRREAVDRAQAALAAALREHAGLLASRRLLLAEGRHREATLSSARATFAAAHTVRELRSAAGWVAASRAACDENRASLRQGEAELAKLEARVRACRHAVQAAEVGRSTAARLLERRSREVSRRTALRLEDEADDAFRARLRG